MSYTPSSGMTGRLDRSTAFDRLVRRSGLALISWSCKRAQRCAGVSANAVEAARLIAARQKSPTFNPYSPESVRKNGAPPGPIR